jgi:hypothetical protein
MSSGAHGHLDKASVKLSPRLGMTLPRFGSNLTPLA